MILDDLVESRLMFLNAELKDSAVCSKKALT